MTSNDDVGFADVFATLEPIHGCDAQRGIAMGGVTCLLCHFVPCGGLGLGAFGMGSSGSR